MKNILQLLLSVFLFCFLTAESKGQETQTRQLETDISRYGSLIKVKKEFEERYIILHRHTFPGVLDRIRKCNIRNYSIFLNKDMLFSHFEYVGKNFEKDMAQMADPVTKDWWKLTDPMQEPLINRKEGEWWASMVLLYQMDTSKASYKNAQRITLVGELMLKQEESLEKSLDKIDKTVINLLLTYNFQNLTLYTRDSHIYLYVEYVGGDNEMNIKQLLGDKKIEDLYNDQRKMLKPLAESDKYWTRMTEIFHTD